MERTPCAWLRIVALCAATGVALAGPGGCAQVSSDVNSLGEGLFPPTPGEAGRWASDMTNPENQRRGIMLLATASFGGNAQYMALYEFYITEPSIDPLVKAASIEALSRHASPKHGALIAKQLTSQYSQVRMAAAKGLQRVHDPAVADAMWKLLIEPEEDQDVRVELAIALGQYPRDDVFQALCTALDQRELAVNLAAADSLRLLTAQDFNLDRRLWLSWYGSSKQPFRHEVPYYYPTFQRALGLGDYLMFWSIPTFEVPGVPAGLPGARLGAAPGAAETRVEVPLPDTAVPPAPAPSEAPK
jgi:hypothetical protein